MDDQTINTNPEDLVVTIDNRQVKLSEAEATLKSLESDLRSRNDKILAEERNNLKMQLEAEKTRLNNLLDEDTMWYKTHDDQFWSPEYYEPKIYGGSGEKKPIPQQSISPQPNPQQQSNQVFGDSSLVKVLQTRIDKLEQQLTNVSKTSEDIVAQKVVEVRDSLKSKYPSANVEDVTARMYNYYIVNNGQHPTPELVEAMMKKSHDFGENLKKTAGVQQIQPLGNPKVAPPITGGVTVPTQKKLPPLESDEFREHIKERFREARTTQQ